MGCGRNVKEVAALAHLSENTLRKHYGDELALGRLKADTAVVKRFFEICTSQQPWPGQVTAIIFWLKCRADWKEVSRTEHTGAGGGPISLFDLSKLKDMPEEEFATLERALDQIGLAGSGEGGEAASGD